MRGLADFLVMVIAAVVFLGFLFIITEADFGDGGTKVTGGSTELATFSETRLGFAVEDKARTVYFDDFAVGLDSLNKVKKVFELEISQGYFGARTQSFDIALQEATISEAKEGRISFDVATSNQYGNLVIVFNGKEVLNQNAPAGHYTVALPKGSLKAENSLSIRASFPGARFWASTYYLLRDFTFGVVTNTKQTLFFDVHPEEVDIWGSGVFNFGLEGYSDNATLAVSVNDKKVYERFPSRPYAIDFGIRDIRSGTNSLTFSAAGGYFEIENAFLNVFLWRNKTIGATKSFLLDEGDYARLNASKVSGVIELSFGRVIRPASLEINFKPTGRTLFITEIRENDAVEATFDAKYLRTGPNTVTISTNGAMELNSGSVRLEKA